MPAPLSILFLGTSDAYHSGGRASTSYVIEKGSDRILVDCGPTTPYRLRQEGLNPWDLRTLLLTHFHGDHTFGLPFLLLHGMGKPRAAAAGPDGLQETISSHMGLAYGGIAKRFAGTWEPTVQTIAPGAPAAPLAGSGATVEAVSLPHRAESLGYRLRWPDGTVVAITGDTGWTDDLLTLARGATALIAECTTLQRGFPVHVSWEEWKPRLPEIEAETIFFVHRGKCIRDRPADAPAHVIFPDDGFRWSPAAPTP